MYSTQLHHVTVKSLDLSFQLMAQFRFVTFPHCTISMKNCLGTGPLGRTRTVAIETLSLHLANDRSLRNTISGLTAAVATPPLPHFNLVFLCHVRKIFIPDLLTGL